MGYRSRSQAFQAFEKSLSKMVLREHGYTPLLLIICWFVLIIIPLRTFAATAPEEELYQQCKRAYTDGNFAEATQHVEKFLSLYSESDHADEMLFMRAFLQLSIHSSMETYQLVIKKYPNSKWAGKAHFQLGQLYSMQGKHDDALKHYGDIVISFPDSDVYWLALYWSCKSFLAKREYKRAMDVLRSLEKSEFGKKNKDMILMSMGEYYFGICDYENAANSCIFLIESMPDSRWIPSAHIMLAKSFQCLGKSEDAKKLYQKVMDNYPKSVEARQAKQCLDNFSLQAFGKSLSKRVQGGSAPLAKVEPEKVEAQSATPLQTDIVEKNPAELKKEGSPSVEIKWGKAEETPSQEVKSELCFSVQVGAFSKKSGAENLANQLRKRKYSVDIIPPSPDKNPLYKVRVGKFKTRDEAMKLAQKLREEEKLDTRVIQETGS